MKLKVDRFDFKMTEVREKNAEGAVASQTLQGLRFWTIWGAHREQY